ncbi:hypothetical protein LHK_02035 [Laribacter hongkongensis HLHK9]|uniref:Uncharacterized protein n=1 Tax=Laribacter hongkongensis (strain HLHK9) TaxID=557598 RepID=C1D980_LARHH|nr:hypothetical protein LHK_02035 [Laribacter hongkongensis HLHK9]
MQKTLPTVISPPAMRTVAMLFPLKMESRRSHSGPRPESWLLPA